MYKKIEKRKFKNYSVELVVNMNGLYFLRLKKNSIVQTQESFTCKDKAMAKFKIMCDETSKIVGKNPTSQFIQDFEKVLEKVGNVDNTLSFRFRHLKANTPVTELDLSVRSSNALFRSGITTIEQLMDTNLKKLRNIGQGSVKEINGKLLDWYYEGLTDEQREEFWYDYIIEVERRAV